MKAKGGTDMAKGLRHYKQARYKAHRKPMNKTVLIGIIAAVVIFALSVALGAYLGSIAIPDADDTQESDATTAPSPSYNGYNKVKAPALCSYPLASDAYTSDEETDRAILRANGALINSLCIDLLTEDGAPSYKSEVYRKACAAEGGVIDLAQFLQKAQRNNISVCSTFKAHSLCSDTSDVTELRRVLELALLSEAYGYGIREVLLTGVTESDADVLYSYVLALKKTAPELAVGIALDADTLLGDSVFCAKLADIFDYIAVDLTSEFSSLVAEYSPAAPSANDTEKDEDSDTNNAQGQEGSDPLSDSIKLASRIFLRYGAKAYIDIGDGCEYCKKTAQEKLKAAGVESFVLSVSKTHHK